MERAGFEPAASGLQIHPITRLQLTAIDRISMTEPNSAFSSNVVRHRSTAVRSHRARTLAARGDNTEPVLSATHPKLAPWQCVIKFGTVAMPVTVFVDERTEVVATGPAECSKESN
jgi:hypothetical protein